MGDLLFPQMLDRVIDLAHVDLAHAVAENGKLR